MKKFSKNIMKVVAILLILVLMTSCIISSTLAAFVVTKDASTTVGFSAFGVTVNLDVVGIDKVRTDYTGESATVVLENLTLLKPDDIEKAITASITGTPSVDATVTINVVIDYVSDNFKVPSGKFSTLQSDTVFVPAGFKVGSSQSYVVTPYNSNADTTTEETVEKAIAAMSDKLSYDETNDCVSGSYNAGTEITGLSNMNVRFVWPEDYDTLENSDEIGTYVAKNQPTFNISYTITVQQN